MSQMKIGSLFSGNGGLDLAAVAVTGGKVVWHCEWDKAQSAILAHNHPEVPNYSDVTKVDWHAIEQVDVLTGGFPCQDLSHAGKRAGLKDGTRSGLWANFADAIEAQRPKLVIIENVRGILSAKASGEFQHCPECMGEDRDSVMRSLGVVLADLARLGYDAKWEGIRASDFGAPHQRFRVVIVAYPANTNSLSPDHE